MGLDMYMFRMKKITEEEKEKVQVLANKGESALEDNGYSCFLKEDVDVENKDSNMFDSILKYFTTINIPTDFIDMQKLFKDNNIPKNAVKVGECWGKKIGFSFQWTNENNEIESKDISLSRSQFEEQYIFQQDAIHYVAEMEEVGYWRKEYELQRIIHDVYPDAIANCGYYILTKEMLEKIKSKVAIENEMISEDEQIRFDFSSENLGENEVYVYHEWY